MNPQVLALTLFVVAVGDDAKGRAAAMVESLGQRRQVEGE